MAAILQLVNYNFAAQHICTYSEATMTLNELLDQARHRANLSSDYALAKALGVQTGHVSHWRKGRRHPSDEEAVQLATLAGIDEMQVIAAIHFETATNEKKREFWKCYLESRGVAATACMIALGISIMLTPKPAEASVLQLPNYDALSHAHNQAGIYIMRISGVKVCAPICNFSVFKLLLPTP